MQSLNYDLFLTLNATPASPDWLLSLAHFLARDLIIIVPSLLIAMWFWSSKRKLVINATIALVIATLLTAFIRAVYPHARPFVDGVGHQFLSHSATSSFPSNHGTVMFTFAIAFLFWDRLSHAIILLAIALLIGWSRIYLGVHWPLDMLGSGVVAVIACLTAHLTRQTLGQKTLKLTESGYRLFFSLFIRKGWVKN